MKRGTYDPYFDYSLLYGSTLTPKKENNLAIQIEVLNKTVTTKPTAKGSYQMLELAYKNLTFQGKVEGRKIMSFGDTAAAFKELANASTGDQYEVEVVKNAKTGYNDWVSAKKSVGGAPTAAARPANGAAQTSATTTKSTYETPEERAKKQIYIVRQSSISSAVDLLTTGAKSPPKVEEVLDVAKQLENYVFGQGDDKAVEAAVSQDVNDLPFDDIPL